MILLKLLGMPDDVSADGYMIDHMMEFCLWFMVILFVGWTLFFLFILWKFRRGRNKQAQYHGFRAKWTTHAELAVILVEAVLLLGFAVPIWKKTVKDFHDDNAMQVHVVAYQFGWAFHYPGADGKFGRNDPKLVSSTNPLGIDWTDPSSKDDVVALNTMRVPLNQKVALTLTSKDVIHNFAAPSLRVARDAIPGSSNEIWFTGIKEGDYDVICGQLCGAGHGLMKGTVSVIPAADFSEWILKNPSIPAQFKEQKVAAATAH